MTCATLYGKLYTKQLFSTGNVSVIYEGIMTTRHLRHVTLSTFLTVDIMARDIVAVDIPPPHPWGEISQDEISKKSVIQQMKRQKKLPMSFGEMLPSRVTDDVRVILQSSSSWFCGSSYWVNLLSNLETFSSLPSKLMEISEYTHIEREQTSTARAMHALDNFIWVYHQPKAKSSRVLNEQ